MPDYYDSGETATEPKPTTSQGAMDKEPEGEQEQVQTAVVPTSIFPGGPPKPGDDCMFTVVRVHGEETQIQYKDEETEGPAENESEMGEMGGEPGPQMSSMSEY